MDEMDEVDRIANTILRLVATDDEERARAAADRLLREHIGSDHKVIDMTVFHEALVQALRQSGHREREDEQDIEHERG